MQKGDQRNKDYQAEEYIGMQLLKKGKSPEKADSYMLFLKSWEVKKWQKNFSQYFSEGGSSFFIGAGRNMENLKEYLLLCFYVSNGSDQEEEEPFILWFCAMTIHSSTDCGCFHT